MNLTIKPAYGKLTRKKTLSNRGRVREFKATKRKSPISESLREQGELRDLLHNPLQLDHVKLVRIRESLESPSQQVLDEILDQHVTGNLRKLDEAIIRNEIALPETQRTILIHWRLMVCQELINALQWSFDLQGNMWDTHIFLAGSGVVKVVDIENFELLSRITNLLIHPLGIPGFTHLVPSISNFKKEINQFRQRNMHLIGFFRQVVNHPKNQNVPFRALLKKVIEYLEECETSLENLNL